MDSCSWEQVLAMIFWSLLWVLIISAVVSFFIVNNKAKRLANAHSIRLAGIRKLNEKYYFNRNVSSKYQYPVYLPNKRSYDAFDPYSYFGGLVIQDKNSYEFLFQSLESNRQLYPKYMNEIAALPTEIPKEVCRKHTRVPYLFINWNEKRLIKKATVVPILDSTVYFHVRYTSPKGRNSYSKGYACMLSQLSANYYQHVITDSMKAFQRSLMTDSLRYDVLKRDGFRCVLCGRTANDGVVLHVDHILPIARGGKTEKSNLRTLCEYCNLGKSAKYDPKGVN